MPRSRKQPQESNLFLCIRLVGKPSFVGMLTLPGEFMKRIHHSTVFTNSVGLILGMLAQFISYTFLATKYASYILIVVILIEYI